MEDLPDAPALAEHLHGDRVDQERAVVGDDLDHGGAAARSSRRRTGSGVRMAMVARAAGGCMASR